MANILIASCFLGFLIVALLIKGSMGRREDGVTHPCIFAER